MSSQATLLSLCLLVGVATLPAQTARETAAQSEQRTHWWREAKFGLFIHWGLYAVPADATDKNGNYKIAEWYQANKEMQLTDYEKFARRFRPTRFDARRWASLAKEAGMKYLVITSKHHDGFCMFDSKLTDYDVVDATHWKHDPMKDLAAECQKHGLKFCFYYSIMDWHHPDYLPRRPWEQATRPPAGANPDRYIDYMKGQLRELLTNYGPIGVIWFDGAWELDLRGPPSPEVERRLRPMEVNSMIRSLQPAILINDRNNLPEDYATPEQSVPASAFPPGRLWETCLTMNDTWGYATNDHNWKSSADLIRKLCDIAHKGGNLLLNVGPTADGEIPPESVERLAAIGAWLKVNGEAIYGTTASPYRKLPFNGRCTVKGDRLYLQIFEWPEMGLTLSGLQSKVKRAATLNHGERLQVKPIPGELATLFISKPEKIDPIATVVELRLSGPPDVTDPSPAIKSKANGTFLLTATAAEINGTTGVIRLQYDPTSNQVTNWTKPKDFVLWICDVPQAGRYAVEMTYTCSSHDAGDEFTVGLDRGERLNTTTVATGPEPATVKLGELSVPAGRQMFSVRAKATLKGSLMNLREVQLQPARR